MKPLSLSRLMHKLHVSSNNSDAGDLDQESEQHPPGPTTPLPQPPRIRSPLREVTPDQVERLNAIAQDYLFCHGGLLKTIGPIGALPIASGQNVGISLHPSPFPRRLFEEAYRLQEYFQELYIAVTRNPAWLGEVLRDVIKTDPLMDVLWQVYEEATDRRRDGKISAGIFRSDYMLHAMPKQPLGLKQVEFNTIACAGSMHGQRVADLHRYLHKRGAFNNMLTDAKHGIPNHAVIEIPEGDNKDAICNTLEAAHQAYLRRFPQHASDELAGTCILMVVQPHNFNVVDERPIEYALWARNPSIPCFRVEWGEELLEMVSLSSTGRLCFHSPDHMDLYEVSVVYLRSGFELDEYEERIGFEIRLMFESSNAVVCPDILTHLAGSKRVQQALCQPNVLELFIDAEKAEALRRTFMPMYPLDATEHGLQGQKQASDHRDSNKFRSQTQ